MLREVFTHDGCIVCQMWVLAMACLFIKPLRSHLYQWLMFAHGAVCSVSEMTIYSTWTPFSFNSPFITSFAALSYITKSGFYSIFSPWPLWYMEMVSFCISSWPPSLPLPVIQNLYVAAVLWWGSDSPSLRLQYELQSPSYGISKPANLAFSDLFSSMSLLRTSALDRDILLNDGNPTWLACTRKGIYWKVPALDT